VSLAEHFFYLQGDAGPVDEHKVRTRSIGRFIRGREILVGVDEHYHKHLLVPIGAESRDTSVESRGIAIATRRLTVDAEDQSFLDVHCRMPRLDLVFERLLEDILERLDQSGSDPILVCQQALDDWQTLLKAAASDLPRELVVGLVGELEVLRRIAVTAPARALDVWRGPRGEVHDFDAEGARLEVKATARIDGDTVHISNLRQLDPKEAKTLHLVAFHVRNDQRAPSLDDRIREIIDLGVPRSRLIDLVAQAGYVYESRPNVDVRYKVLKMGVWLIAEDSPGLRHSAINPLHLNGVVKVNYDLQLAALPRAIDPEDAETMLSEYLMF